MCTKRLTWLIVYVLLAGMLPALAQAQDSVDLDATFEAEDGSFSLAYPSDWYADMFFIPGFFIVATSEAKVEQMTAEEPVFPPGEMLLVIVTPQASSIVFMGAEPATPDEAMEMILVMQGDTAQSGEAEAITIGDYDALVTDVTTAAGEGVAAVIELDDGEFVLAAALAAPGEFAEFEDTVMAILASMTYGTSGDMVAFTSEDGSLTLEYPAGWAALEQVEGDIHIMNEISFDYTLHSGQVVVAIATPATVEWYLREGIGLPDDPAEAMASYWTSVGEKELGEVSEVTVGDYTGTRLDFTTPTEDGYVLLLDVEGGALAIQIMTATGELADFDAEVTAILESLEYTPPEE